MTIFAGLVWAALLGGGHAAKCPQASACASPADGASPRCCPAPPCAAKARGQDGKASPIATTLVVPLASPTVAPAPRNKFRLSVEARAASARVPRDGEVTLVSLPVNGILPVPFAAGWIGVAVAVERPPAAHSTPPTPGRTLPTPIAGDGRVVPLPALPDAEVHPASDPSGEPRPSPQARPSGVAPTGPEARAFRSERPAASIGRTIIQQGYGRTPSTAVWEELVLFPVPVSQVADQAAPCVDEPPASTIVRADSAPLRSPAWKRALSLGAASVKEPRAKRILGLHERDADAIRVGLDEAAVTGTEPTRHARGTTLGVRLRGADGRCAYEAELHLQSGQDQPHLLLVPMEDGSSVEVQVRVRPAPKD